MYRSSIHEQKFSLELKIPWDSNTARGFAVAVVLTLFFIFTAPLYYIKPPVVDRFQTNTIPIEILNFGAGDGTGLSKGNLSAEGAKHKGANPQSNLHDAQVAALTRKTNKPSAGDPNESSNLIPVSELSATDRNTDNRGSHSRNVGSPDGSEGGTGLGDKGAGPGKGLGFGDIEWGGGGNRIVLYKKVPQFPPGANTSAQIRIRFTVLADGTVSNMVPLQKGDPILERSAMEALRQWRFNPLKEERVMVGIITFTFRLS